MPFLSQLSVALDASRREVAEKDAQLLLLAPYVTQREAMEAEAQVDGGRNVPDCTLWPLYSARTCGGSFHAPKASLQILGRYHSIGNLKHIMNE